jgi:hypothetical protein
MLADVPWDTQFRLSSRQGLRAGLWPVLASACGGLDGRAAVWSSALGQYRRRSWRATMSHTNSLFTLDAAGRAVPAR